MRNLRGVLLVAAAAVLLGACGTTGDDGSSAGTPTPEPTGVATAADGTPADGGAAGDTRPATVALSFDGLPVPIATACTGADGAVLATTDGEVTVTLVQEDAAALRYSGEGMTAETTEVTVEEIGESTVYRATLESEQVPAVEVTFEVGDTSELEDCPA